MQRTRVPVRLALLVVLLLTIYSGAPASALACSCAQVAPLDALAHADAVVAGHVVAIGEPPAWPRLGSYFPYLYFAPNPGEPIVVTIAVDIIWKGQPQAQVKVISQHPATDMCAAYFSQGATYLIYAMRDGENLRREICQRMLDLPQAGDDLVQLGPGVIPAQPAQVPPTDSAVWLLASVLILGLLAMLGWRALRSRHPK
jgi:hypothetical protein